MKSILQSFYQKAPVPQDEVDAKLVTITPAMAAAWLEVGKFHNRRLDTPLVERISGDIKAGKWLVDGNAIRFDSDGNILDGQHRLQAIIKANKKVESFVIHGLSSEVINTIDTGRIRTTSDILHFNGYLNTNALNTCARWYTSWLKESGDLNTNKFMHFKKRISSAEILGILREYPDMVGAVSRFSGCRNIAKLMGVGTAAFLYMVFNEISPTHAESFFNQMESGANLEEGSPVLTLRTALFDKRAMKQTAGSMGILYKIAFSIRAWNAFREGRKITRIWYNADSESFPQAK